MAYLIGAGVQFMVEIASVYTQVPQAKDITPPQLELGTVETTHLLSAAREFMPTIHDGGECSFNLEWDPADAVHAQLFEYFSEKAIVNWRIIMADAGAAQVNFSGFLTTFGVDQLTVDSVVMIPCSIRITGLPTITP